MEKPTTGISIGTTTVSKFIYPTDTTTDNSTDISIDTLKTVKKFTNDQLFVELKDLTNEQFKPWYMKMFYLLGSDEVLRLASQARKDGVNPRKLFSSLLKKSSQY